MVMAAPAIDRVSVKTRGLAAILDLKEKVLVDERGAEPA
jgi:hypothetical protein